MISPMAVNGLVPLERISESVSRVKLTEIVNYRYLPYLKCLY